MLRSSFLLLACMLTWPVFAKVQVRWFGITSILIEDEQSKMLFDPMFTRPSLLHWLNLKSLKSNEELVKTVLKEEGLQKLDALFVTHGHFDHSVDAPLVAKHSGALLYVDENIEKIAKAYKDPSIKTARIKEGEVIQVGQFKVTPLLREHDKIWQFFEFLPGPIRDDFNFGFYEYHLGQQWFYLIEHREGKILLDGGPEANLDKFPPQIGTVNMLIQGIANRKNDAVIIEGHVNKLAPQSFMPIHFDNIFRGLKDNTPFPLMRKDELLEKLSKTYPKLKIIDPKFGESYTAFP